MKIKLTTVVLAVWMVLFGSSKIIQAQGSGCPTNPTPEVVGQYQVIEAYALAPAIPETTSSQTPGVFYEDNITLVYQPGWHVIIASTPDGAGQLCSDDLVKIQVSSGLMFEHDFRSADRSRILPLEPLDVTALFTLAGEHTIQISLVNLVPPQYSSSPYYLVVVEPDPTISFPPPANIFTPIKPILTPTLTPSPQPTTTPTPSPTRTPTSAFTPTSTLSITLLIPEPPPQPTPLRPQFPPRIFLGVTLLVFAAILVVMIRRRPQLTGVLEISKDGDHWKTVDLSVYGRQVTIGSKGRIKLDEDEEEPSIPAIAARLLAERGPDGSMQVVWQHVEDDSYEDSAVYRLKHGDEEVIERYHFVYQNFSESETIDELFEGGILNEI